MKTLIYGSEKFVPAITPVLKNAGVTFFYTDRLHELKDMLAMEKPGLLVVQEALVDISFEEFIANIKALSPDTTIIVSIKSRDANTAVRYLDAGVYECLYEPLHQDEVDIVLKHVLQTVFRQTGISSGKKLLTPIRIIAAAGLLIALAAGGVIISKKNAAKENTAEKQSPAVLPANFRLPYLNPAGITSDGEFLWICDWYNQTIYQHRIDSSLTIEKFYRMPEAEINLALASSMLWTLGQDNMLRKHVLDAKLSTVLSLKTGGLILDSIAFDGKNLWSSIAKSKKIIKHSNDDSLTPQESYDFPGAHPVGMSWSGKDLWLGDDTTGSLYLFVYENGLLSFKKNVALPDFVPGKNTISGVAADGKNVWVVSEGGGLIFRYAYESLTGVAAK